METSRHWWVNISQPTGPVTVGAVLAAVVQEGDRGAISTPEP